MPSARFAFCPQCGTSTIAALRFCGGCGLDFDQHAAATAAESTSHAVAPDGPPAVANQSIATATTAPAIAAAGQSDVLCPRGHSDGLQKVSAAFLSGSSVSRAAGSMSSVSISHGQNAGWGLAYQPGSFSTSSEQHTTLASLLAPPPEPVYHSPWGVFTVGWIILVAVIGYPIAFGQLERGTQGVLIASEAGQLITNGPMGALLCFLITTAAIVPVIHLRRLEARRRRERYVILHDHWDRRIVEWNAAYYCHRDALVFMPGSAAEALSVGAFAAMMADVVDP